MKKLFTILFLLIATIGFCQSGYITKDSTFLGWNARMTFVPGKSDSTNIFVCLLGAGEVGTDTTLQSRYLAHYWLINGWDGGITLGNGTHYPVYVTLQPTATYQQAAVTKPKIDAIIARFKVRYGGLNMIGLSNGGWMIEDFLYSKPSTDNFVYANMIRSAAILAGVVGDDGHGVAPNTYPGYFGYAAKRTNYRVIGFEQVLDNRAVGVMLKNMADSVGSNTRFPFFWTNFGGSGHSNFNDMASPFQTNWTLTNPDVQNANGGSITTNPIATGQNIYQWMLRQDADTSLPAAGALSVSAGATQVIELPASTVTLTGSVSGGTSPYTYLWTKVSGPNTPTITAATSLSTGLTGLVYGSYVYQLTATDNVSATASATVSVIINYSSADLSISSNNITVAGSATGALTSTLSPNHNILSTTWTKLTTPTSTLKKLVFIGSSTTAGYGLGSRDSAYAQLVLRYYGPTILSDTNWNNVNLAQTSTDIFDGQPTGYTPTGSQHSPLAGHNITAALALSPDIIFVNYPSNSYDFLSVTEVMQGFRRIKASCDAAGVLFVTSTTQPRTNFSNSEQLKLVEISDSIKAQFPNNYINFYDVYAQPGAMTFKPAYALGDGVHGNGLGQKQLFNKFVAFNILKSFASSSSVISSPNTNNTNITNSPVGVSKYQVSIIDNRGLAASSVSTVTSTGSGGGCPTPLRTVRTLNYTSGTEIYRPSTASWQPGDTIKIIPTTADLLEIYGGGGTACDTIIIVANTTFTCPIIRFKGGAKYYKLLSTGAGIDTTTTRSIHAENFILPRPSSNVAIDDGANHITIEGLRIRGGDIGFYCKSNVDTANTATWYPNSPQTGNSIIGCFLSDINGEGMYIGPTQENGYIVHSPYTGNDTLIGANRVDSTRIINNYVTRTAWDLIQLAHAGYGNEISGNIGTFGGLLNISNQQAGIIVGGDVNGNVFNNIIKNVTGNGIEIFGFGTVNVYNNTLDSTGTTTNNGSQGDESIYANNHLVTYTSRPPLVLNIYNNSIGHPQTRGAIRWATGGSESAGAVYNNTFCIPGATGGWQSTYLILDVPGTSNTNNILSCAIVPPDVCNCIRGLFRLKN